MSLFEATGHIGLPYLYLGCGFAKKPYFFYFSSSLFCDAESTTTDNIVFRKPTRPSLALRKAFSKTHQSSLNLKGGSTSHLGLLPSGKKRKPLLLGAQTATL